MQRRYVNFRWKKFNKGQRLCWNSNNWRKTALQDLVLNMATSGCTIHDGFWHFGEGSGNQFDCNSKVRALRLFWEISRREMQKGARWFYASDSDCGEDFKWSGPTVRRQLFWDCNKQSVCNTQHARLNVSWSGRRVGLMDFDKLRESDCKQFWLFTHLQFVSTVAVLIPVASLFHLL